MNKQAGRAATHEWVKFHFHRMKRDHGYTQTMLGKALNISQPSARDLLIDKRALKAEEIPILEREFGVDFALDQAAPTARMLPQGIPNLDIHAGLGNGGLGYVEVDPETMRPLPEYTDGDWLLPPTFMARLGDATGIFALVVTGDSMLPTIAGGSAVFVDTKQNYPSPPGLFVVDTGDGRLVKRVELIPRSENIRVISDNKEYGTYEFHREEVQVFGRVIAVFSWNE